ncbi:lipoprotein [Pseudomonadales bacterium]|nr:lipoprotein [Pseudomonadales bacterium]
MQQTTMRKTVMQKTAMRKTTPFILFLLLSAFTTCITACGQTGALYLPQETQKSYVENKIEKKDGD